MTDRELMQMALDALEEAQDYTSCPTYSPSMTQQCATAAVALRARLAQPEPEPVAWYDNQHGETETVWSHQQPPWEGEWKPLYTAPSQREWQELTDEEIREIWGSYFSRGVEFARAIEAKLKAKNV